ncbi:MAG TPA: TIGR03790 family protein [Opitutaceae bacterium]
MHRLLLAFIAFMLAASLRAAPAAGPDSSPAARVIILANGADPDSLRLAHHYAERRGVPAANLIVLPLPVRETISWAEFVSALYAPLQDELVRRGWIDAVGMDLRDELGRRKYAVSGHRIAYLVVCRGVPLKIQHDPALYRDAPPLTHNHQFRVNSAAIDAELSLLAQSGTPINAFVPNPLFRKDDPTALDEAQVVKVSRLDAPTFAQARALVDAALAVERTGLIGRAYVDIGGPHKHGDQWLEATARELEALHFDLEVQRDRAPLAPPDRADAAALYFGWYAGNLNGPFALPGYRFAPGAIALHIHSFSAPTLRQENGGGWCGPFLARGVAATFGNVNEPYLELTHQPQLLLRALARGDALGDAAYYALPALSWQAIVIGDPLYRPFKVTLAQQWSARADVSPRLRPYLALREAHRLEAEDRAADAEAVLRTALADTPALALGLERARRLAAAGNAKDAARTLEFARYVKHVGADEWGLLVLVARRLAELDAPAAAVAVWRNVLAFELPKPVRLAWLREAATTAAQAGNLDQSIRWERELIESTAPVKN